MYIMGFMGCWFCSSKTFLSSRIMADICVLAIRCDVHSNSSSYYFLPMGPPYCAPAMMNFESSICFHSSEYTSTFLAGKRNSTRLALEHSTITDSFSYQPVKAILLILVIGLACDVHHS